MKSLRPETLSDQAYSELKQAIIKGQFSPGELLPEESLAATLGISRTPIKKAITKLAYEGLVDIESGKVARVGTFSERDLRNFIKLRKVLEVFSAGEAAAFVTKDFIELLYDLCEKQRTSIQSKDYYAYIMLDTAFHVAIAEKTGNAKLQEYIEQINTQLHRYLILSGTLEESAEEAVSEHQEIIHSLEKQNAVEVENVMKKHIENVEKRSQQH